MDEAVALKLLSQCGDKIIQILKAEGKLDDDANSGSVADDRGTDAKLPEQSQRGKDESGAGSSQQTDNERESMSVASSISSYLSEQEPELSDVDADQPIVDGPSVTTETVTEVCIVL